MKHSWSTSAITGRAAVLLAAVACSFAAGAADQLPPREASRGELLYTTHCIACHTAQVHWRDRKTVRDWPGLVATVRHWQAASGQAWSQDDVVQVARHLDARYYGFAVRPEGK